MHFIQSQTHNGTHAEGTYKYAEEGPDMAGMPLASYLGEAVVCDFSAKAPGEAIEPDDLRRAGVRRGDIVLAVYEAVANAAEHACKNSAEPGTVTVRSRHRPNGALEITVTDTGTWDPSPSERFRGRGLALITVLSDTHALTTGPDGTTVTMCWQPMPVVTS